MEKKYINENVQVTDGADAAKMIADKNDAKYWEDKIGIRKVEKSRWKEAQNYERYTWCVGDGKFSKDDRNQEHKNHYDGYKVLSSKLKRDISVIELGCGPYTNLNVILPIIRKNIISVDLLDPLLNDYMMASPNCTYKSGSLLFYNTTTVNSSIEEFTPIKKYDLVVMINVLEHCFDIDLIFEKVYDMMNEGGLLVFADKVMSEQALKECVENIYDAGHPIRISETYVDEKIKPFKTLYSHDILDENGAFHDYKVKYLILQK